MQFEDHYSGHADAYARHRPRYPDELFAWLASVSRGRALAWDAGTGSGQVAVALTSHFDRVIATDASSEQLAQAIPHERVEYRHEPVSRASLAPDSVDLVTAGAAAHWFDLEGFYREVARVGRKRAVVALFSYGPRDFADAIGPIVHRFQEEILGGYWPERIQYVHERYATLPFPFDEIAAPAFSMTADWNLAELLAFLETWSASQRYFQERGDAGDRRDRSGARAQLGRSSGPPSASQPAICACGLRSALTRFLPSARIDRKKQHKTGHRCNGKGNHE